MLTMLIDCRENLKELSVLLDQLDREQYTKEHFELSRATIGQHTRHIIELYQSLIRDYSCGLVNYDDRKRDLLIETDPLKAQEAIVEIIDKLDLPNRDLEVSYLFYSGASHQIASTYYRELLYNLEHSIHHQALIKVALYHWPEISLSESFGIAPATLRYRAQN